MRWFRRARPRPGERVVLRFDDSNRIEFNDYRDALHHMRVHGAAGAVGIYRDQDNKVVLNRNKIDKELNASG